MQDFFLHPLSPGQCKRWLGWMFEATQQFIKLLVANKILRECFCLHGKYLKLRAHHWLLHTELHFWTVLGFVILWSWLFLTLEWNCGGCSKPPLHFILASCQLSITSKAADMYAWRSHMVGWWNRLPKTPCICTEKCFDWYFVVKDNLDCSPC